MQNNGNIGSEMNFLIGFIIVFAVGVAAVLGAGHILEIEGFSEKEILIGKAVVIFIVISIPPILVIFGRKSNGETQLEQIGKPVTSLASLVAHSLSNPINIIIFLIIIIINISVWK